MKIFSPLTSAVIDCLLDGQAVNASEFTQRYVGDVFARRTDKWGTDPDAVATEEFTNLLAMVAKSVQLSA